MIVQLPGGQWKTPGFGQSEVIALPGGWWEKRATSGLYVPSRPKSLLGADGGWHAMTGTPLPSFGAVKVTGAPPGNWAPGATKEEYAAGFSMALGGISTDVRNQIAASYPRLGFAVDGMSSIIEAVSGKEPGWPMAAEIAQIVTDVLVDLLTGKGSIAVMVQEVVQEAAQAIGTSVSAVAGAIPFVGALVQVVCRVIEIAARPTITAQERAGMDERYRSYCAGFVHRWNDPNSPYRGTDPFNAVSLADMFSQNDARAQVWRWLAGGASRNSGVRSSYNSWLQRAKGKYGITGIPLHVMRQMNEMMDGVFAARQDPNRPPGGEIFTDNGAGVGSILLHVTRDQLVLNAWNRASAQSLADNFVAPGRQVCVAAEYPKAGSTCDNYPPCGQHSLGTKLGVAFFDFINGYDKAIMNPHSDIYIDAEEQAKEAPKTNTFTLNAAAAAKLTRKVQGTAAVAEEAAALAEEQLKANAAAKKSSAVKAAALSSAVLLGGGGFLMARRVAKKRGR